MKKLACIGLLLGLGQAQAAIIDFTGGTAYLANGAIAHPTDTTVISNVDYYIEDGIRIDFIGGTGTIGNYYGNFTGATVENSVIHSHWHGLDAIVFSKVDNTTLSLNYIDLVSNTVTGGGRASGNEQSFITASNGTSELLPSSDWGFDKLSNGTAGDGIERLWMGSAFDDILSFTITSENAFCFGLDNFYIDVPAPEVPEPASLALLGLGLIGLKLSRKKRA